MSPSLIKRFGAARMAVGALSWLAPGRSERLFGLGADGTQPLVTQLFGARDFALGLMTATSTPPVQRQVLWLGVAVDTVDALATARQVRAGTVGTYGAVAVGVGAASFAAIGALATRA